MQPNYHTLRCFFKIAIISFIMPKNKKISNTATIAQARKKKRKWIFIEIIAVICLVVLVILLLKIG